MIRKIDEPAIAADSTDWWTVNRGGLLNDDPRRLFARNLMALAWSGEVDDLEKIKSNWPEIWAACEESGKEAAKRDAEIADWIASDRAYQLDLRERDAARAWTQAQKYTNKRDFQPKGMQ